MSAPGPAPALESPRNLEGLMRLLRPVFVLALALALCPLAPAQGLVDPATEAKIDALLARMTLEEKVGQLNQYSDRKSVV